MKILLYTNHWVPSGVRTYGRNLYFALKELGHEVDLIWFRGSSRQASLEECPFLEGEDFVKQYCWNTYDHHFLSSNFPGYDVFHCINFSDAETNLGLREAYSRGIWNEFYSNFGCTPGTIHTAYGYRTRNIQRCPITNEAINRLDGFFYNSGQSINPLFYPYDVTQKVRDWDKIWNYGIFTRLYPHENLINHCILNLNQNYKLAIKSAFNYTNWGKWLKLNCRNNHNWLGDFKEDQKAEAYSNVRYTIHEHFGYSVIESWCHGCIPILPDSCRGMKLMFGDDFELCIDERFCYFVGNWEVGQRDNSIYSNIPDIIKWFDRKSSAMMHIDIWNSCKSIKRSK